METEGTPRWGPNVFSLRVQARLLDSWPQANSLIRKKTMGSTTFARCAGPAKAQAKGRASQAGQNARANDADRVPKNAGGETPPEPLNAGGETPRLYVLRPMPPTSATSPNCSGPPRRGEDDPFLCPLPQKTKDMTLFWDPVLDPHYP